MRTNVRFSCLGSILLSIVATLLLNWCVAG